MKIKVLWGFEGDPEKLKAATGRVLAGSTLELDDDEYAHALIGKGLAEEAKPAATKAAKASENK